MTIFLAQQYERITDFAWYYINGPSIHPVLDSRPRTRRLVELMRLSGNLR